METTIIAMIVMTGVASWILTGIVRSYALRRGILDFPNARSSHVLPTPRGGGLAIVIVFLGSIGVLAAYGVIPVRFVVATIGGGVLVASIGWLDDRYGMSVVLRSMVHGFAALWALYWLGGLSSVNLGITRLFLGRAGFILGVVGIVWCVNLYNFMDGIDGLAGLETVTAAATVALLLSEIRTGFLPSLVMTGTLADTNSISFISWLLVSASAGFLVWNRSPARIFMGDVGSGFIGFTFGVLAVASENLGVLPLLIWILLLGVFIVDATATLIRRIRCRERLAEPHRTHAYQLAVRAGYSHKQVTLAVLVINIILGGAAMIACAWPRLLLLVVAVSGAALVIVRAKVIKSYEARCGFGVGVQKISS
ncbi:MAG: glycosyltransferase family 4 protein [Bacillota bacterium]